MGTEKTVMETEMFDKSMDNHKPMRIFIILAAVISFVGVMIASFAGVGMDFSQAFNESNPDFRVNEVEINPAPATFIIWGPIYVWQVLFLAYGISTIFRKGPKGGKLYYDPNIMPPIIYALYVINMAVSITWTVLFDRQQLVASLVVIAMFPLTLWIMIFFACRALVNHGQELYNNGMRKEIWLLRILVHNALGIYATWTTIATLLSLAITLTYRGPEIANDISSTIALALLSGIALFYYVLDFCFIERYVRFLLTPYIVVPGALVGIITHNWDPTKRNFIFTAVLLGVTSVFGLIKFIITLWKSLYRPLFVTEKIQDSKDAKMPV